MSFSEYRGSEQFKKDQEYVANVKKREQELATQKKNDLEASYSDTGGLPKNLRYPYARIEDGMDFLKIQIATYTPPDLNLETLLNVPESKNNPTGDGVNITRGSGSFALTNATDSNTNVGNGGRVLKRPKHTIFLPIPRQIQDANSVSYDSSKLDPLEAAGAALIKQGIESPSVLTVQNALKAITDGTNLIGDNTDALPMSAKNNGDKGKGVFIKQPDIFQLRYMKGASEHPFLNKFLPMHLTDMKINYAASGTYSTFYDGTPSHMSVSCSFQEVNPVYQEDFDDAGQGVGY
jgi:hypothetical protein